MAAAVISRKIIDLKLDPKNSKKHTDKDVNAIAQSLKAYGQQTPIVVYQDPDEETRWIIVKGNGTYLAAKKLGWADLFTVTTTLQGQDLEAYGVADNQTATLSEWDIEKLQQQVSQFSDQSQATLGFDSKELKRLLDTGLTADLPDLDIPMPDEFDSYSVRVTGIKAEHKDHLLQAIGAKLKEHGFQFPILLIE